MVGYGIGSQMVIILRFYQENLCMVAIAGCYCSALFKGCLGVTLGRPPLPHHLQNCGGISDLPLGTMVTLEKAEPEVFG